MSVIVYQFTMYDIAADETRVSNRMATEDAIRRANGAIVPGSACEIAPSDLDPDQYGMTRRGFWKSIHDARVAITNDAGVSLDPEAPAPSMAALQP